MPNGDTDPFADRRAAYNAWLDDEIARRHREDLDEWLTELEEEYPDGLPVGRGQETRDLPTTDPTATADTRLRDARFKVRVGIGQAIAFVRSRSTVEEARARSLDDFREARIREILGPLTGVGRIDQSTRVKYVRDALLDAIDTIRNNPEMEVT